MTNYDDILDAIYARATGALDHSTTAYVTDGGTHVIASSGAMNDDLHPHDLLAILPAPVEGTRVMILRPTVNPELVAALRAALDPEVHDYEPEAENRITLDFEDAKCLHRALAYIGDPDAPVMISRGEVVLSGGAQVYELWDDFDAAIASTAFCACVICA